jgi:hypothetical protein
MPQSWNTDCPIMIHSPGSVCRSRRGKNLSGEPKAAVEGGKTIVSSAGDKKIGVMVPEFAMYFVIGPTRSVAGQDVPGSLKA